MCGCNKNRGNYPAPSPRAATNLPAALVRTLPVLSGGQIVHVQAGVTAPDPPVYELATVDTSVWGPPMWRVLHIAAHVGNSNRNNIHLWRNLLATLMTDLPCPDCRHHYTLWYNSHPIRVTLMPQQNIRNIIIRYLHDLHNDVNQRTGKAAWTVAQAAGTYGRFNIQNAKDTVRTLEGIIGGNAYGALNTLLNAL